MILRYSQRSGTLTDSRRTLRAAAAEDTRCWSDTQTEADSAAELSMQTSWTAPSTHTALQTDNARCSCSSRTYRYFSYRPAHMCTAMFLPNPINSICHVTETIVRNRFLLMNSCLFFPGAAANVLASWVAGRRSVSSIRSVIGRLAVAIFAPRYI